MRGAGRQIGVMQVIGLDTCFDEGTHERFQRFDIVVDAPQQHTLANHRNAGIDQTCASGAGLSGQFAGMIGVQSDIGRGAGHDQCGNKIVGDTRGIDDGNAGVPTDDLHMGNSGEAFADLTRTPCVEDEGIAAGQDHLPNLGMCGDISERSLEGLRRQGGLAFRPDHLAAKTETAVDRTSGNELE